MHHLFDGVFDAKDLEWLIPAFKALLLVIAGYFVAKLLAKSADKFVSRFMNPQQTMLIRKVVFFGVLLLFIVSALQQLHFKLTVLLGSAGILTGAVAFASKTSISNVISGIFLIAEKSFVVGDTVKVNSYTGKVESIDLLSVKIRTFDNTMVRVPNEKILSGDFVNLTAYPTRRIDITIGVNYGADLAKVTNALLEIAAEDDDVKKSPEPAVKLTEFADSSINLCFSTWVAKSKYASVKNKLQLRIKEVFEQADIDIPFPQLTVHMQK